MRRASLALAALLTGSTAGAYPIDGYPDTGITRLEAYRLVLEGELPGRVLYYGAQLKSKELGLRLAIHPKFDVPPPDPAFTEAVTRLVGDDAPHYGIAILDITDPRNPRYAAHQDDMLQNPGSVGKIVVALGWFQALADRFPDDVEARADVLRNTRITADEFIIKDSHEVPFWQPGEPTIVKRPIQIGDTANLWTWLDWMCSSSSNAAAATLQKHLMLFRHFGGEYPVSAEQAASFFENTPKEELKRIYLDAMVKPLERNGIDPATLRQGSFFTYTGKARVPGVTSHATARGLLQYVLLMEQGRLVDIWSSLEIKKLLYLTDGRVRYAASPALFDWALVFKSGSLYSCRPEKGFDCGKYMGNRLNYMNSVTMVEGVDPEQTLHYIAVVLSNVLKKNSAELHKDMGTRVHHLIESMHPPATKPRDPPPVAPAGDPEAGPAS